MPWYFRVVIITTLFQHHSAMYFLQGTWSFMLNFFKCFLQDCAGAILYSTEKAVEVALEGMQSMGGNGYINGTYS